MNNTRIYKERERHYNRLVARLSKAQNKGGSKSLQARLSARLERCLMQLKQLSTGVAVLAALGWTAPAIAQNNNTVPLNYVEKTGVDNPFDTISINLREVCFVDIDGDGDQDMIAPILDNNSGVHYNNFQFYKNIGSPTMPAFELQANSTMLDSISPYATGLSFVDIDGDGDQDLFASNYTYYSRDTASTIYYYKNISTNIANPNFQLQSAVNNPLQKVADYYNGLNLSSPPSLYINFIDFDGNGTQDCFVGAGYGPVDSSDAVLFYKNIGTSNNADFELQTMPNNPLGDISTVWSVGDNFGRHFFLFDGDSIRDQDIDIFMLVYNPRVTKSYYFKNLQAEGTLDYVLSTNTPIDNISLNYGVSKNSIIAVADLTGDGRTEMLFKQGSGSGRRYRYFADTVSYLNHLIHKGAQQLNSYPNPSTGLIQLNETLTGQLRVCNTLGQEVYSKTLNEVQQLDLSTLSNGVYILHIRTKEEDYVQQVTINHL